MAAASKLAFAPQVAVLCTVFLATWQLLRRKRATCPAVPGVLVLGNLPELLKAALSNRHLEMFVRHHRQLGQTIVYSLPLKPEIVVTTNPRNVEHMLKGNFENFVKGWWSRVPLTQLLGDGIFNVDGALWHTQRKTASKMFTAHSFKEHIWQVVHKNTTKVQSVMAKAADTAEILDVFKLMNRFTLDSIGEIGFGVDIGALEDPTSPFLASFDHAQKAAFYRFVLPDPVWRMLRLFGLGTEQDSAHHFQLLDSYSRQVVRELNARGESGASFVGLFLQDARAKGQELSEDFLRDLVLNFLIAGRDTTAQALAWTIFCISGHHGVEEAIQEELDRVVGDGALSYPQLSQLSYLQAVINEALRLFPSVPMGTKICLEDDHFPDGTFVPADTVVVFGSYAMARDEALWGPDASHFRPERWLNRKAPPSSYEFAVFNAGPRECLGKRLAYLEMKACLAHVFQHFVLSLALPRDQVLPQASLTIGMSSGLPCKVKRRR